MAEIIKKFFSFWFTPLFYGFAKLGKSINNVLNGHKPFRSFLRAGIIGVGTYYSVGYGIIFGSTLGSIVPIIGNIVGAIVGGFIGGIFGSTLVAFMAKHFLRFLTTVTNREPSEGEIIFNSATHPHKYVVSKQIYENFLKKNSKQQENVLEQRLLAVKDAKTKISWWKNMFWTKENAQKAQLNQLAKEILKDPDEAIKEDAKIELSPGVYVHWNEAEAAWILPKIMT